jgi:hypothetical protein
MHRHRHAHPAREDIGQTRGGVFVDRHRAIGEKPRARIAKQVCARPKSRSHQQVGLDRSTTLEHESGETRTAARDRDDRRAVRMRAPSASSARVAVAAIEAECRQEPRSALDDRHAAAPAQKPVGRLDAGSSRRRESRRGVRRV